MGISTSFIQNIILFGEVLKYSDGAKFLGYVGTDTESLGVQFCNLYFGVCFKTFNFLLSGKWADWFFPERVDSK
jgi:hypothetical protein